MRFFRILGEITISYSALSSTFGDLTIFFVVLWNRNFFTTLFLLFRFSLSFSFLLRNRFFNSFVYNFNDFYFLFQVKWLTSSPLPTTELGKLSLLENSLRLSLVLLLFKLLLKPSKFNLCPMFWLGHFPMKCVRETVPNTILRSFWRKCAS